MRITKIEASNVLGLARADLNITTPVFIVAGPNEAGKSTLSDAISMAMTGLPRRVKLKKELGQLLHDGGEKGRVTIYGDGGETLGEFRLPKGEHASEKNYPGHQFIDFALDTALFARQSLEDRRSMLFALTKCKMSRDELEKNLVGRGIAPWMAAEAKSMVGGGYQAASKEAAQNATQAKGAWRAVTGMNWGANQSEGWESAAVEADYDEAAHQEALAIIDKARKDIDNGTRHLGELMQKRRDRDDAEQKVLRLRELASTLQRATHKHATTTKELADWRKKLEDLLAKQATQVAGAMSCPCCAAMLVLNGNELAQAEGEAVDHNQARQIADDITKAREAVALYERTLTNDQKAIDAAENATHELGLLQQEEGESPEAKIEATQEALAKLKTVLAGAENNARYWDGIKHQQASWQSTKDQAAKHHEEVKAWLDLAEALSPNGIPAELLAKAMTPVNDSLKILAGMSGWAQVVIEPDMDITYGGRLYGLCSESAKWRADTMIALAIAQISELKMVVLDRFDVLDIKGRVKLLGMLSKLGKLGAMDTMIMCGTMKALPGNLADHGASGVWVENAIAESN